MDIVANLVARRSTLVSGGTYWFAWLIGVMSDCKEKKFHITKAEDAYSFHTKQSSSFLFKNSEHKLQRLIYEEFASKIKVKIID